MISLVIPAERQDNQNVVKLKGLRGPQWRELVDAVYRDREGRTFRSSTTPCNSSRTGKRRRPSRPGPTWSA